jgi:hypothetical protein
MERGTLSETKQIIRGEHRVNEAIKTCNQYWLISRVDEYEDIVITIWIEDVVELGAAHRTWHELPTPQFLHIQSARVRATPICDH